MRTLFLALVLANLVAFIWYGWLDYAEIPHQSTALPHVASLRLVAELTPAERQALAKSAAPPPPVPRGTTERRTRLVSRSCVRYGPFPSADTAHRGIARLQQSGATVTEQLVPGKVRLGYWVYLPAFSSRREADATAQRLKERGLKDLYVVGDEANRNAISLGLFTDRGGAVVRQRKLRRMGYHPVVAERFRDVPHYWLDGRGTPQQLPAARVFARLVADGHRIGRTACGPLTGP